MRRFLREESKNHLITACIVFAIASFSHAQSTKVVYDRPVHAACTPDSVTFSYTGSTQTFVVPSCVTSITVRAWGGGGGGGGTDTHPGADGGGGAYATSTLAVAPGSVLTVIVGGGGAPGANSVTGTGGGAGGYGEGTGGTGGNAGGSGSSGGGGGGGGGSAVLNGATILIDAAGGGGGSGGGNHSAGFFGGGGDQAGGNNTTSSDGSIGASGSINGGNGAGPGGNDGGGGGGGGGGDNGGTGGGGPPCDCGGGSAAGGNSLGTSIKAGNGTTVGGNTYSTLPAGTGTGGTDDVGAGGQGGGNGYIVIIYCMPTPLTVTATTTNPTCGNNNGTATINVGGGTGPFTYSWSNGATASSETTLGNGTYTVIAKDAAGCEDSTIFTLNGSPPLRDSISSFTNVSVACGTNGTATVGVKGGAGPYSYSWTGGQTTPTATNLGAGSYTVIVTDANGCTASAVATITQPGALTASIASTTNVSCNGGANGTATGSVTGGSGPYSYAWTGGQTTTTATNLSAGSYTLSITDANGCTVSAVATITQPSAIRDSISASTAVLCNGQSNGTATTGVKNGTGPYTYAWTNGQTVPNATGLAAGSYTVVVTDANGCKDSSVATITQPTVLKVTAAAFAATCNGSCNGSCTVIPAGGTGPYTYAWSNGPTIPNDNNLCAGTYSVVITDNNGCTHDSTGLIVTQPTPISLTKTTTTAFCNQADGSATVTITGGTPPYLYQWSNGATTTNINNVTPGPYCFGVEDANKCLDSICVIIPNTPGETASIVSTTTVTCNGGANGTAISTATGGTAPYTYLWSNAQNTDSATGLSAGTYTITVTDATGCTSTAVATITQPALVVASTLASPVTICVGDSSNISASSVGGTGPYTYAWSTGATTSSCWVNPVVTSTYTVTPTDVNGCTGAPVTVVVDVNPPLSVTVGPAPAMCPGASATITAKAGGGSGTYTYTWLPGPLNGATQTVSPAATTYYTVVVTDGCTVLPAIDSEKVIVDPLPLVAFTQDTTNGCYPVCVNFTDKTTIASGGIKSWNWNFGDGNNSVMQNPIDCYSTPGSYNVSVTVTSDSGCSSSLSMANLITVYDHPHTSFSATPQPVTIADPVITFTDQTVDAYGLRQWFWNFGDSLSPNNTSLAENNTHTYSDTGTYCIKLIDMNLHGCIDSSTDCIVIEPLFTLYVPNAFTPNHDGINDVFLPKGMYFNSFDMYIFDRWGQVIFHSTDQTKGWNGSVNNDGTMCQQDTYIYHIHVLDFNGADHYYTGRVTLVR